MQLNLGHKLFPNSAEAINGRGVLMAEATLEEGKFVQRLRDTDPGIPDDLQTRFFDPFVTTRGRDAGTGLGLPFCRKLNAARLIWNT